MCLIITKPIGSRLPKGKRLRRWFNNYPDGFGLAFLHEDKVRILKGAMNHAEMFALLDKMRDYLGNISPQEVDIVFQFRAAFTGGVVPRFCHPFPITSSQQELDSLDVLTECALAHNGVIFEYAKVSRYNQYTEQLGDINDAQEFIKDYLVDMGDALYCPSVQKLIGEHTMSKFALLSNRGINLIGEFIHDNGLWFSNDGYKSKGRTIIYHGHSQEKSWSKRSQEELWEDEEYLSKLKGKNDGGVACDYCQSYCQILYALPDDDASCVCTTCFTCIVGHSPMTMDIAHWASPAGASCYLGNSM